MFLYLVSTELIDVPYILCQWNLSMFLHFVSIGLIDVPISSVNRTYRCSYILGQ